MHRSERQNLEKRRQDQVKPLAMDICLQFHIHSNLNSNKTQIIHATATTTTAKRQLTILSLTRCGHRTASYRRISDTTWVRTGNATSNESSETWCCRWWNSWLQWHNWEIGKLKISNKIRCDMWNTVHCWRFEYQWVQFHHCLVLSEQWCRYMSQSAHKYKFVSTTLE